MKKLTEKKNREVYFEALIENCKKLIEDKEEGVTHIDDLYTMRSILDDILCDYEAYIDLDFNVIFEEDK